MTVCEGMNSPKLWDSLLSDNDYIDDRGKIVDERINFASSLIQNDGMTLNIGSGQGFLESNLIKQKRDISNHISLDVSINGLKRIKSKSITTIAASATNLPFKEKTFQSIVCMEVLEHFTVEKVPYVYSEIMRVAKNNSRFIFSVPVYEPRPLKNHPVGHYRKYIPDEFLDELQDNHFEIKKVKLLYSFSNYYLIKSYIAKLTSIRRPAVIAVLCT